MTSTSDESLSTIKRQLNRSVSLLVEIKNSHDEKRQQRQNEIEALNEYKEIFLVNQVRIQGRRRAVSDVELKTQVREWKSRRRSYTINRTSDLEIKEVKKILEYQYLSNRRYSE